MKNMIACLTKIFRPMRNRGVEIYMEPPHSSLPDSNALSLGIQNDTYVSHVNITFISPSSQQMGV